MSWIFLTLLFFSRPLLAQMSLPSVFPDAKSVNPGVISLRRHGQYKLASSLDFIKKQQDLTELNGHPFSASEVNNTTLTDTNFFRGGKGGGLTSEFNANMTRGKQKSTVSDASGAKTNYNTDTTSNYYRYAVGLPSHLGLEFHQVTGQTSFNYNSTVNGQNIDVTAKQQLTVVGGKLGMIFGSPDLSFGVTGEYNGISSRTTGASVTQKDKQTIAGLAVGTGGSQGLLELGVEADPFTPQGKDPLGKKYPMPLKATFIAEHRFADLILGYKGMAYSGNFIDLDRITQHQLLYQNGQGDVRLEHVFNFLFASDTQGLSFGGMASFSNSKSKEKSGIFLSDEKHSTKTSSAGFSLRVGFVY